MSDTPETDDLARGNHVVPTEWAQQLERERDEARNSSEAFSALAWKLEGERNEARKRIERQRFEIVRLNGATNHAGGTPLSVALRERDEAREKAERYRLEANAIMMQRDEAREEANKLSGAYEDATNYYARIIELKEELNEARENLDQEIKFHHRTHSELIETQCKLLDMEMKCDQLQDEIKRLKVILDLIKKDVS